jgi:hypothetical protein
MPKNRLFQAIFFGLLALLMLSELFFSNFGALQNNLEGVAHMLGISVAAERVRLYILMVLDAIAGGGALMAMWALLQPRARPIGRWGVWAATLGLIGYGAYQFLSALFQLGPDFRFPVMIVGVIYAFIGLLAWRMGRVLR